MRRRSRRNPLSPQAQQWLLLGLGAVVVGGVGWMVYTTYQNSVWPPSADVQNGILNQILATNAGIGGMQPTAAQSTALAASIAQLPAMYVASLPAGTAPSVSGYQTWATANMLNYVASGGAPGGYSSSLQQGAS
jgi:hypothetical protein